jgi:chemotaxis protein MotB
MKKIILIISIMITSIFISCVTTGKYEAVFKSRDSLQVLHDSLEKLVTQNIEAMRQTTIEMDNLHKMIGELGEKQNTLQSNYEKLKSSSSTTTKELMDNIEQLQLNLAAMQKEKFELQEKYNSIQNRLQAREEAMNQLKSRLQNALIGFAEKGMTVSIKNGKVYVSLSNQLLFSSGSTDIDSKGKEALLELANILNEQTDINILVEGHTDDQSVRAGARFKDNWDLSVLRSTEVVRFLTEEGNVDPLRIMASGRGEYFPIEKGDSPQIRAMNRRTEIILTPKLEEIFEIINE